MKAVFFYSEFPTNTSTGTMDYLEVAKVTMPINRRFWDYSIVYSTLGTKISRDIGFDRNIPIAHPEKRLTHYIRVLSWLFYLESARFDQDTVFLDSDVIINKDFRYVFENDFALAFSVHQNPFNTSLVNAGVFFAKHSRKDDAIYHLKRLVKAATQDRYKPDSRFPFGGISGIWGLDELCLRNYIFTLSQMSQKGIQDFVWSVAPDEFRPLTQGISLFGYNYNMQTKEHDPSLWPTAKVLHFRGICDNKPEMIKKYLSEQGL